MRTQDFKSTQECSQYLHDVLALFLESYNTNLKFVLDRLNVDVKRLLSDFLKDLQQNQIAKIVENLKAEETFINIYIDNPTGVNDVKRINEYRVVAFKNDCIVKTHERRIWTLWLVDHEIQNKEYRIDWALQNTELERELKEDIARLHGKLSSLLEDVVNKKYKELFDQIFEKIKILIEVTELNQDCITFENFNVCTKIAENIARDCQALVKDPRLIFSNRIPQFFDKN